MVAYMCYLFLGGTHVFTARRRSRPARLSLDAQYRRISQERLERAVHDLAVCVALGRYACGSLLVRDPFDRVPCDADHRLRPTYS